jgi:hypothetical protein
MSSPVRPYEAKRYDTASPVSLNETPITAVFWPAVAAGAFVAGAMSLTLMTLGAGIGLSSISPWPDAGVSTSRVAPMAIIWIILVQILSSALGGYLAGRLRTKWVALHTHEVYFRDTAHGFMVWAVGLVITAIFLSSSVVGVSRNNAFVFADTRVNPNNYYIDALFRTAHPEATRSDEPIRAEAGLILANAIGERGMLPQDRDYLAQLVVTRTGLSKAEANRRVDDTIAQARNATDNARKALAHSFYWLFVALLFGAFFASYAATIGGKQRDSIPAAAV